MYFGTAFVMPYDGVVRNIHVLFSSKESVEFVEGITIYPFVCLATSNSADLVYTIVPGSITYTDPYVGGVAYPRHTLRRGASIDLDIPLPEGTLVAIIVGMRGDNVVSEQYAGFGVAGGMYIE